MRIYINIRLNIKHKPNMVGEVIVQIHLTELMEADSVFPSTGFVNVTATVQQPQPPSRHMNLVPDDTRFCLRN